MRVQDILKKSKEKKPKENDKPLKSSMTIERYESQLEGFLDDSAHQEIHKETIKPKTKKSEKNKNVRVATEISKVNDSKLKENQSVKPKKTKKRLSAVAAMLEDTTGEFDDHSFLDNDLDVDYDDREKDHKPANIKNKRISKSLDEANIDYNEAVYFLSGQKLALMRFFIKDCIENKSNCTNRIRSSTLSKELNISRGIIKTLLARLKEDSLLSIKLAKRGAGGFLVIELPQKLIDAYISQRISEDNTPSFKANDEDVKVDMNIETTEFDDIDISPLESINLTRGHLKDIKEKGKLSSEIIQSSIEHFSYELSQNKHKVKDPLKTFVGTLCKGNEWNPIDGYKSKKQIALEAYRERLEKEKQEEEQIIAQIIELNFDKWVSSLSEEEIDEISPYIPNVPEVVRVKTRSSKLKEFFRKNELPKILKEEGIEI